MPYDHLSPSGAKNDERVVQIYDFLDLAIVLCILDWISRFTANPNTVGQILPDTSSLWVFANCSNLRFEELAEDFTFQAHAICGLPSSTVLQIWIYFTFAMVATASLQCPFHSNGHWEQRTYYINGMFFFETKQSLSVFCAYDMHNTRKIRKPF